MLLGQTPAMAAMVLLIALDDIVNNPADLS